MSAPGALQAPERPEVLEFLLDIAVDLPSDLLLVAGVAIGLAALFSLFRR